MCLSIVFTQLLTAAAQAHSVKLGCSVVATVRRKLIVCVMTVKSEAVES